ncbi:DNA-3-methyladenine glycosylase-like [Triticum dicoccoides]|uniref:DNA-3-methyladenine glycosylase-like n=1 Tax=Triticum dicoccoides TaxID=85692 RepID=UPI00188F2257|nr:DNA-3-methyladenine glycosylase-like [Triticum dicoccoides]
MLSTTAHHSSRQTHAFEKSPSRSRHGSARKNGSIDRKLQLQAMSHASKYLQRMLVCPPGLGGGVRRSGSGLSLSSLSLSQNSSDSSLSSSNSSSWEPKVPLIYGGTFSPWGDVLVSLEKRRGDDCDDDDDKVSGRDAEEEEDFDCSEPGGLHRCSWITKNSDEAYIQFHDESWGVPVYSDDRLFELLTLSGMLIDHNWTEILKRRDMYMEAFVGFDPNVVAKMNEDDIAVISANKELKLAECRVRCIVENAKCIRKVAKEFGSFSGYIWGHMNHRPMVGKYKHHKYIPLRTPKSEGMSKDLIRRGFRLVGPVIVYSFMQASGMVIDHLVGCFRFSECVRLAERSWGITNVAT